MTLPSLAQTANPSVIKPVMQPHMLNINTTGTSGFRSPSVPPCVNSQPNVTFPALNISQVCVPFPSDTATSGYQFPSPASAGGIQTTNSVFIADSAQVCDQALSWPGIESWNSATSAAERTRQIMSTVKLSHGKRKILHYDEGPGHAPKIFIDEEQMSAHLQELNLDNSNINWQHNVEQRPWYTQQTNNNNDVVDFPSLGTEQEMKDVDNVLPQLELSDEVKRSIESNELLPKTVLQEISKPCMQIVLWKPPEDLSKELVCQQPDNKKSSSPSSSSDTEQPSADMEVLDENNITNNNVILSSFHDVPMAPHVESSGNNTELYENLDTDIEL